MNSCHTEGLHHLSIVSIGCVHVHTGNSLSLHSSGNPHYGSSQCSHFELWASTILAPIPATQGVPCVRAQLCATGFLCPIATDFLHLTRI